MFIFSTFLICAVTTRRRIFSILVSNPFPPFPSVGSRLRWLFRRLCSFFDMRNKFLFSLHTYFLVVGLFSLLLSGENHCVLPGHLMNSAPIFSRFCRTFCVLIGSCSCTLRDFMALFLLGVFSYSPSFPNGDHRLFFLTLFSLYV